MEKILIFGGRGYIAGHLKTVFSDAVLSSVDICDQAALRAEIESVAPTIIINAAGKTGKPNVDWCESHKTETIMSNVHGPLNLLDECAKRSVHFVHIGSGCTYEGDNGGKGFTEDDPPNFSGSFYARSKLWIDQILKDFPVLQLRLRMPFDGSNHPRSLISKLKKYGKVLDEQNSLTYLPDFLIAAKHLIGMRKTGIYNVVNPGTISPYQIMKKYAEIVDSSHAFERLTLDHLGDVVKAGRSNCLLSCAKLQAEGVSLLPVADAVELAMKSLV